MRREAQVVKLDITRYLALRRVGCNFNKQGNSTFRVKRNFFQERLLKFWKTAKVIYYSSSLIFVFEDAFCYAMQTEQAVLQTV